MGMLADYSKINALTAEAERLKGIIEVLLRYEHMMSGLTGISIWNYRNSVGEKVFEKELNQLGLHQSTHHVVYNNKAGKK